MSYRNAGNSTDQKLRSHNALSSMLEQMITPKYIKTILLFKAITGMNK
jgi:hypothetical protein